MKGYIHSVESFGTVDGPGVRFVVFFQGCPMRCQYCHNPDTWNITDGKQADTDDIIADFTRNRAFYKTGGITATGGEPMFQIDFLTDLFKKAKEAGVHTCLDTSGIMFNPANEETMKKVDTLMEYTDLVMLDIKHMWKEEHVKLTGQKSDNIFAFAMYLSDKKIPIWIRHVVVPDITFKEEELKDLGKFIATLDSFEKLEILPYHSLGKVKYENLGMDYVLEDTRQLTKDEAKWAKEVVLNAMEEAKR